MLTKGAGTHVPLRPSHGQAETRILIAGISWEQYLTFEGWLREGSPIRTAFDGENLEIMTVGPSHDALVRRIETIAECIADGLDLDYVSLRSTTWLRARVERGIQADACFCFDPGKVRAVNEALERGSNDVADYPDPDLAVEVDLSPPELDREGVYARIGVPEVWIYDGNRLTIRRLTARRTYRTVKRSPLLSCEPGEVEEWLADPRIKTQKPWKRAIEAWASAVLSARR